jgi:hypothetical protein
LFAGMGHNACADGLDRDKTVFLGNAAGERVAIGRVQDRTPERGSGAGRAQLLEKSLHARRVRTQVALADARH